VEVKKDNLIQIDSRIKAGKREERERSDKRHYKKEK
jgi:hypothetical protein